MESLRQNALERLIYWSLEAKACASTYVSNAPKSIKKQRQITRSAQLPTAIVTCSSRSPDAYDRLGHPTHILASKICQIVSSFASNVRLVSIVFSTFPTVTRSSLLFFQTRSPSIVFGGTAWLFPTLQSIALLSLTKWVLRLGIPLFWLGLGGALLFEPNRCGTVGRL